MFFYLALLEVPGRWLVRMGKTGVETCSSYAGRIEVLTLLDKSPVGSSHPANKTSVSEALALASAGTEQTSSLATVRMPRQLCSNHRSNITLLQMPRLATVGALQLAVSHGSLSGLNSSQESPVNSS